jgi:hypothetical protein
MHAPESDPLPYQVFNSISNRRLRAFISIAAGIALVLVAVAGFFFALRSKNSNFIAYHALTTFPMIIAVGLFASAYPALRSATRVIVGEHDLTVFRGPSELGRWPWTQIALASTAQSTGHKQILKLYGDTGKLLVTLTEDLEAFPAMVDQIKRRMAQNPSPQRTSVAHRTGRRRGIFLILGGLAFLALAAANAWLAFSDRQSAHLLKTQGQPTQAIIIRKFTAPDGHTRRVEYRIDAPSAPLENVEINPALWQLLQEQQRVPAVAVPGRPDISRLTIGQIDDRMNADPNLMLFLSAGITLMSLFAIAAGLLNYRGLDLKWDKSRHRPRLARIGED